MKRAGFLLFPGCLIQVTVEVTRALIVNVLGCIGNMEFLLDMESLRRLGDPHFTSFLAIWTYCYRSDPHIALGKYSPLEKEILHLGGTHTIASRRLLAYKQKEERKMLKELQLLSADYQRAIEYKKQHFPPCATGRPLEKLWTVKVTLPPQEVEMPPRERLNVSKHIERMQLARARRGGQCSPAREQFRSSSFLPAGGPTAGDEAREQGGDSRGERGEAEEATTKRQEIKMSVSFKSEEPEIRFTRHPKDLKPFLPTERAERATTGLTNRNLLRVAEFPGDLLLMTQDSIARGLHPRDWAKANPPEDESVWKKHVGEPACHHY